MECQGKAVEDRVAWPSSQARNGLLGICGIAGCVPTLHILPAFLQAPGLSLLRHSLIYFSFISSFIHSFIQDSTFPLSLIHSRSTEH